MTGLNFQFVFLIISILFVSDTLSAECNFKNGQCVYDMHMGQQDQCNSFHTVSTSHGSGAQITGSCSCDDVNRVTNQMRSLQSAENTLKTMMSEFQTRLNNATAELSAVDAKLQSELKNKTNMQSELNSKQTSLNTTKAQLETLLTNANTELNTLRGKLASVNRNLTTCQSTLGVPVTASSVTHDSFTTFFCGFEPSDICGFIQERHDTTDWLKVNNQALTQTGPKTDHTYGNHYGYYMALRASSPSRSSSGTTTAQLTSPYFNAAPNYCLRFWYTLYGKDIKDFNVYVKVHGGTGYPVFTRSGNIDTQWHLAEVSLDKEYTGSRFQIVFEAQNNAYKTSQYHSGGHYTYTYYHQYGDIAFDDVTVYNTSCSRVPSHPPGAFRRQNNDNSRSYYTIHPKAESWYEATKTCREENVHSSLATITDAAEQNFLVNIIQGDIGLTTAGQKGFYINGNDYDNEGAYKWTTTGYPHPVNYTNWKLGQPNNVGDNQDCILMEYPELDYQWGDVTCSDLHPFICETLV